MSKRMLGVMALLGVLGVAGAGVLAAGPKSSHPKALVAAGRVEDRAADAKADKGKPGTPRARVDITSATAEYRPDGFLNLAVTVREPANPYEDPNWMADGTFLTWEVDTTGDGREDYEISLYNDSGKLTGDVTRDATEADSVVCPILLGSYIPEQGYQALVDPKCLGYPTTVAYRVTYHYQTDPESDDAPVITDTAPDKGMALPIEAPAAPPAG